MPSPRRHFLAQLGAASLTGIATPSLLHAAPAPAVSPKFGRPDDHALPIAETWDMSWTARVNGKYRAAFDSPEIGEGGALVRAVAWCDMYKEVYGTDRAEMSPVLVIRHAAIDLIMNDAYWATYEVGKDNKLRNEQGKKWMMRNPLSSESAPNTEQGRKYTLQSFLAGGGIVLGCGWAFRFVASRIAKKDKLEAAEARKRATAMIIPGVILQPNGIFAVLRAQEAGCHYVLAS
ncbi:MAG TPA: hypothetical protein VFV33_22940 [Gemmatimonadaceae bacterium]|nr:hypothetical protein [Gemmatimonadaceae bacterium]